MRGSAPQLATPRGLFDLLDGPLRERPEAIATGTPDRQVLLSYRGLARAIMSASFQLRELGVSPGDTVAIVSDNCVEMVIGLLAVVDGGAIAVPVNPHLAAPELAIMAATVHAKASLVPEHLEAQVAAGNAGPVWTLRYEGGSAEQEATVRLTGAPIGERRSKDRRSLSRPPSEEDVALVMLTGGTTGKPKAVPLTHGNLAASIRDICATYALEGHDATLVIMPLTHGHGLIAGLLSTLASGGAAFLPGERRFSAHAFWPEMTRAGATWFTAVPTVHQILVARAANEYPHAHPLPLRFIRTCSAAISPTVEAAVESAFHAPLISAYGMTETAHQTASNPLPSEGPRKRESVGLSTGVELRIAAADGRIATKGMLGEVEVKGPTVMYGYLEDPSANDEAFDGGWFRTGDLGVLDDDGYLFLKGRIKELINRGGEKIFPQAVDAVLLSEPRVREAASYGVPDEKYGEEIHAAIVLKPGATETPEELRDHCAQSLGAFEIPKRFVYVSELPKTEKGSIDRHKLMQALG